MLSRQFRANDSSARSGAANERGGLVTIAYTTYDEENEPLVMDFEYSKDSAPFAPCTEFAFDYSDGRLNITADQDGESHVFVWDSLTDLGVDRSPATIVFRIIPTDTYSSGLPAEQLIYVNNQAAVPTRDTITVESGWNIQTHLVGDFIRPGNFSERGRKDLAYQFRDPDRGGVDLKVIPQRAATGLDILGEMWFNQNVYEAPWPEFYWEPYHLAVWDYNADSGDDLLFAANNDVPQLGWWGQATAQFTIGPVSAGFVR